MQSQVHVTAPNKGRQIYCPVMLRSLVNCTRFASRSFQVVNEVGCGGGFTKPDVQLGINFVLASLAIQVQVSQRYLALANALEGLLVCNK
jgi:hypothetical protein